MKSASEIAVTKRCFIVFSISASPKKLTKLTEKVPYKESTMLGSYLIRGAMPLS